MIDLWKNRFFKLLYYDISKTSIRIRELRIKNNYSQETAAQLLGIDRSSLSHIEKGVKGCSVDLLIRIAQVYKTTVDYLLSGRDQDGSITGLVLDEAIRTLSELRRRL